MTVMICSTSSQAGLNRFVGPECRPAVGREDEEHLHCNDRSDINPARTGIDDSAQQ